MGRRLRFPKARRIVRAQDYRRAFKWGSRQGHRYFAIHCHAGGAPWPRLGLAVGKRHFRTAVARNRLKRVIRESFRHHAPELPALDIVVVARPQAAGASHPELYSSLAAIFSALARHGRC